MRPGWTIFFAKRLLEAMTTLFVIASMTFLLLRVLPGGPFDSEKALPEEIKASIEARYGLDKPLLEQYTSYLTGLIRGDWGESYKYLGRSVTDIIRETLPVSAELGLYSLVLALLIGIPPRSSRSCETQFAVRHRGHAGCDFRRCPSKLRRRPDFSDDI